MFVTSIYPKKGSLCDFVTHISKLAARPTYRNLKELMKIFHIIGNGFDLNIGMKTNYSDFCKFYCSIQNESVNIKKLKKAISCDFETWANLELEFGKYIEQVDDIDEFDEVFEDLRDNLSLYLKTEEENFDFTNSNLKLFFNNLYEPENALPDAYKNLVKNYKENWSKSAWIVRIMTLNYTHTIEKMLNESNPNLEIAKHHNGSTVVLRGLEHIHGFYDKRMILGINDISQLTNSKFHSNQEILEALIKPNCNKAYKHTIDDKCKSQIESANLISVFGSSIGETDKYWWELIGEQLKRDCMLIIFTRSKETDPNKGYKHAREERKMITKFLSLTNLKDEDKRAVQPKIIIGVNTELFSNILKT